MAFSQQFSDENPSAAYELIYHIDASKEPSVTVYEENGQQKVSFFVPLSADVTSKEDAERLAVALAAKITQKMGMHS